MTSKLDIWNEAKARKTLKQRLLNCFEDRRDLEHRWQNNEKTIYNTTGETISSNVSISMEDNYTGVSGVDQSDSTVSGRVLTDHANLGKSSH